MTNILQEQQQQCAQLLEIAMVSCKKIALWVDQVESTSRLSDSASRQSCEQLAMDFVACFKSGENAEVLDQFFDFQLEAEAVAMYEELDEVVALQQQLAAYQARCQELEEQLVRVRSAALGGRSAN